MSSDQIAPVALRLPVRERVLLAASLWESIEDAFELAVGPGDEQALALAEARDGKPDRGAVAPISHEELMRRVRQ
jgi:hypothetical protein